MTDGKHDVDYELLRDLGYVSRACDECGAEHVPVYHYDIQDAFIGADHLCMFCIRTRWEQEHGRDPTDQQTDELMEKPPIAFEDLFAPVTDEDIEWARRESEMPWSGSMEKKS